MRASRTIVATPKSKYHRTPSYETLPERKVRAILEALHLSFTSNKDIYTRFNQLYPIRPDFIVRRAVTATPMHTALFCHGTYWHKRRKRRIHDVEHRNILETEGYHVFELAYGTRPNNQYWAKVEEILTRIVTGENIRYAGRIGDLLALSMTESDAIII